MGDELGETSSSFSRIYLILFIIIGVLFLAIIGIMVFYFISSNQRISETEGQTDSTQNLLGNQDAQDTINRGLEGDNAQNQEQTNNINSELKIVSSCGDEQCFKEKWTRCESATMNYNLEGTAEYDFEIIGKSEDFCELKIKFVEFSNSAFAGKEMNCKLDNSIGFSIRYMGDIFSSFAAEQGNPWQCQGPLYEAVVRQLYS